MGYFVEVLKKYAVFSGRATRSEFWYFTLVYLVIMSGLAYVSYLIEDYNNIAVTIFALLILLPSLGVTIRRLHDIGKSGWWIFIQLVPFIGWLWFLILMLTDTEPRDNIYGKNPKAVKVS